MGCLIQLIGFWVCINGLNNHDLLWIVVGIFLIWIGND